MAQKASRSSPPPEIVEEEKEAYREALPPPSTKWPASVQLIYRQAVSRLFEEQITAKAIVEDCGFGDHNVYSEFTTHVDYGIKEFIVHHRVALARTLLQSTEVSIMQVALSIGYSSHGGFAATFKRHVGVAPSEYREQEKDENAINPDDA